MNHKVLSGPFFPFEVRTDYVKVTEDTVLVPLTLQIRNRDITFNTKDGVSKGEVNILGRVATITDHVVQTFEQTLEVEEPSRVAGQGARPGLSPLVGFAAEAGPVPRGYCDQGREQPRPHRHLGRGDHGAQVSTMRNSPRLR